MSAPMLDDALMNGLNWTRSRSPVPGTPKRHPLYYLEDGNIVLLVENNLLKIHRYFLTRESAFFLQMFSLPQAPGSQEGQMDEHPLSLGESMQVTLPEIEAFLNFIYYGMHNRRKPVLDEWMALLSVSHRFDCPDIRTRAIEEIDNHPAVEPVQRILVATKYEVAHWLLPAYIALCTREKPLSVDEGERLGMRTAMLLSQARERIRAEIKVESPVRTQRGWTSTVLVPPPKCAATMALEPGLGYPTMCHYAINGVSCVNCGRLRYANPASSYDTTAVTKIVQEVFGLRA